MSNSILSISNISKQYPGVKALDNVSIDFKQGEAHALVGENGAGKSTLIKIISGAETPDEGYIQYLNEKHDQMTPHLSRNLGIEVIYQEFNLIPTLSVAENIFLGVKVNSRFVMDANGLIKKASDIFKSMNVKIDPSVLIEDLSVAYMQLVEIAKAISKEVKILIMDEPTAPLTVSEVEILYKLIEKLKQNGVTILYISHRMQEIFDVCDRVTVLRDGQVISTRNTADTNRQELIKDMVGRTLKESFPTRDVEPGEIVFEGKNLTGNGVNNINFQVRAGEIVGIGGLVGAGRTELVRAIFGAEKMDSGEMLLNNKAIVIKSPKDSVQYGIGMVPEDRKNHGAILETSIKWNITLSIIKSLSKNGIIDRKKEEEFINKLVKTLRIKTPSLDQDVKNLSGGNQQKVVLAKWLASNSKLLIFDEPTRGIDVGAKLEIYNTMNELAKQGIAIIMISSEMPELLGMSDRLVILSEGEQTGTLAKEEFNQELVLTLASGDQ